MATIQESTVEEKIDINTLDNENLDSQQEETKSEQIEEPIQQKNATLDRVIELTNLMATDTDKALNMINTINRKTEFLAINALIEASRAGDAGKGFQVVAESIDVLASKTKEAVETMRKETISEMEELGKVIQKQSENIKGNRLSDLALTNIDLIDRNLYERTADVRWWATDDILVKALSDRNSDSYREASQRLATILRSYTVYADLVLLDVDGNAIANGKPEQFDLTGRNYQGKLWFQSAMRSANGDEYGFQSVHKSVSSGMHTMTFSCKVHEDGDSNKRCIGVLAAVFNWDGLAQQIMTDTPLNEDEKGSTRVCIVDNDGTVLADTQNRILSDKISFPKMDELFTEKKSFRLVKQKGEWQLICHGLSPGYETYSSGWHSLIISTLNKN